MFTVVNLVSVTVATILLMTRGGLVLANQDDAVSNWANIAFPRSGWTSSDDVVPNEKKKSGEEVLGSLLQAEDAKASEGCFGRTCVHSDQCCKGSVCVDMDNSKLGSCLPIYAQKDGEPCRQDSDCEEGLRCLENVNMAQSRTCRVEARDMRKKQINDDCITSRECDVSKGHCCQLQRRHKAGHRRVCFYFSDPQSCLGGVDPRMARPRVMGFNFANPFFKARLG